MGTQLPQKKGTAPTQFSAHVYQTAATDEDATWYGSIDLGPCHIVLDGDQAPLPAKVAQQPLAFFSADVYCDHGRPSHLSYCC